MIICENDELREAAEFFAKILKLPDDRIVAISVYDKLDSCGYCIYHEEEIIPYCIVGIEEAKLHTMLEVLGHELVHAKQYFTGELEDCNSYCIWKGTKYKEAKPGSKEYYFSPWEIEAFGMQVGLLQMYLTREEEDCVLH